MFSDGSGQRVVLEKFELYSTKAHYYLVGHDKAATAFRLLKLSRLEAELEASEDPCTYTKAECTALLRRIRDGNTRIGGLQSVCKAAGLIGCFRFLEGFYLLLVTQRRYHGTVCGQKVYGIDKTLLVPLVQPSVDIVQGQGRETAAEKRYRKLLLSGLELNKDFYFSYTYNLARTLQANLTADAPADAFDSMFVWNEYLSRPLRQALQSSSWVIPLIHGFWQQRSLALFGRTLTVTLIARRSKHFAGTRYRKRGVNFKGQVANDVEAEQLVDAGIDRRTGMPQLASIVQVRGSIPLYWNQEGVTHLKPDITLQHYDPLYTATRLHFEDVSARYGHPVVVLNLVKSGEKRPRETILRKEFAIAIAYINQQKPEEERISYIPWDFNYHAKQRGTFILSDMASVIRTGLDATSFFSMCQREDDITKQGQSVQLQHGVLRTNCIDCLDRTNVAQFAYGLTAMGQQLHALGLADTPTIDAQSSAARQLMDMYEVMGNVLSRQYGGSEAHSTFFQRQRGDWEAATQSRDLMTSIRRFYSNAYTDAEKQDAINLFLGNFVPHHGHAALWELDSDYFLHAGQKFSKPPSSPIVSPAGPSSQPPSSPLAHQAEAPSVAPSDDDSQQPEASDAHTHRQPSHGSPTSGQHSGSIMLPQLQSVDLENVEKAGQSPYSSSASAKSSASLRDQVKQTVAEASSSQDQETDQSCLPSSSSTTAAIAVRSPAGTNPQAFWDLVGADAASLGSVTAVQAAPQVSSSPQQSGLDGQTATPNQQQWVPSSSQAAADEQRVSADEQRVSRETSAESTSLQDSTSQLPTNLSMLQFARQSEADRYQKKPKLESFDKIIGRPPNTPHHVSLQAAPTQKAYLPQWLASPLGMQPSQRTASTVPTLDPKSAGDTSLPASRLTTEDAEVTYASHNNLHRDTSLRVSPPRHLLQQQAQFHQADPNDPYTPPRPARPSPTGSVANPFSTSSHTAFSPDRHTPPRPLTHAASDTTTVSALRQVLSSSSLEPEAAEDSFVSLPLQTVRPTALRPYQAGQAGRASPGSGNRTSPGLGSGGMQRARSLDTRPSTSSSSGAPSPGVASSPMRYPSFAGPGVVQATRSMARAGSLSRHTGSKHSPRRRITFPSILPLFSPTSSPLEPVQEGEQLPSRPTRPALSRRRSTPALKKQAYQRNHHQSRSLDLVPGQGEAKQGRLGMSPELAAWWGEQGGAGDMGADPLQGWLGREQQARAVYKSFLSASQSPLDPFEQWALEDKYASLCNFVVHISMDGFAQGAASKWRHTEGLRGSITCAEDLLKDLASQCRSNAV
ncbi:hypothetical protein WJX82_010315 [Trebouxia sp. C0006]